MQKPRGVVLLVAGVILLFWGYDVSNSLGAQLTEAFTGSPSDKAMYLFIGGGVCTVAGIVLVIIK
ncbi:MAG: DUF3185 family protein [Acidiferrobacterales bacterium]